MPSENLLDVRDLTPPEPLERVLTAIGSLGKGQYLRVRHHREPFPLYPILQKSGFAWLTQPGLEAPFEIFIWRRNDEHVQSDVQRLLAKNI